MSKAAALALEPRKKPVQARSTASVQAILQATIQVLLQDGSSRLTTTRIAQRAGVSVGTLYQYFPNKRSLLQALLKEHLEAVALAMEVACESVRGASLEMMGETIAAAFVHAKLRNLNASVALYAISDEVEGKRIASGMQTRITNAMTALFRTAPGTRVAEPEVVALTLLSAMAGVSRAMLEKRITRDTIATMEKELTTMVRAYLQASAE